MHGNIWRRLRRTMRPGSSRAIGRRLRGTTRVGLPQPELLEARIVLAGTPHILFLGNSGTPTFQADGAVYSFLQSAYGAENVEYKQASATNNTTDLNGVDVLVLSSTPGSGDYRNKFHNSALPILNWEEAVMDAGGGEFGLSSSTMIKSASTTQMTVAIDHPITAGLTGTFDYVTAGAETVSTSSPYPGVIGVTTAANGTATTGPIGSSVAGNPMILIADAGQNVDPLSGASPAKGRRVMFPMTDATFNSLTPQGLQLFANSIDWLAGNEVSAPEIANDPATNVGAVSADLGGQVTAGGASNVTLYYGDNDGGTNPGQWDNVVDLGSQFGSFAVTVDGLTPATTYFFTTHASNDQGTAWATPAESFMTSALSLPALRNAPAVNIGSTYATAGGEVTGTGNDVPTVTLYWGDNDGGVTEANWDFSVSIGPQVGTFETFLSGLDPQTTYYFRAKGENAAGIAWAPATQSFVTISPSLDDIVMYNDHVAGALTHVNATAYSANGVATGPMRDFATGLDTPVILTTTGVGINYAGATGLPADGTDAFDLFDGIIDFGASTGTSLEIQASTNASYTHRFSGLDAQSVYDFAGTAIRGNDSYTNRWTLVTLVGAEGFTPVHSVGAGIVTNGLAANQAALWVGANHNPDQGFVVRWSDIDPGADGEFEVVQTQYTGAIPTTVNPSGFADGTKGYGLTAVRLVQSFDAFTVVLSDPAAGEKLASAPTTATLDFNLAVDPASLSASDLTVDGIPATAVQLIDSDTVRWTLPPLGAGGHTLAIAADAIASVDGPLFVGFQSPFSVAELPAVATAPATGVSATSARIGAQITSSGFDDPRVTVYWGTTDGGTNPANWQNATNLGFVGVGTHRATVTGLDPSRTYYSRAAATNVAGTQWASSSQQFTTGTAQVPTIANEVPQNIGPFSADLGGVVVSSGNDTPHVTIFYGQSDGGTNPNAWEHSVDLGLTTGAFRRVVSGLAASTQYHFRSRATNVAGTAWAGSTSSFTTAVLPDVVISELLASNSATLTTRVRATPSVPFTGQTITPDWIEIQNPTGDAIDLAGFHLTDNPEEPLKWTFPIGSTIPGFGHIVVFASGRNITDPALDERQFLHTNFVLSAGGEYLAITGSDGAVVFEYAPEFPQQRADNSYGLDGLGRPTYFTNPTPGASNDLASAFAGYVDDTRFDIDRGFYTTAQDVSITTKTAGATLVYTTDGSLPTLTNGTAVSAANAETAPVANVTISTTTTLRAAAFKAGLEPTNVDTHTYIFLDDVIQQPNNPAGFPTNWGGAPAVDYEMDPDVVNDATLPVTVKEALTAIPTLSLVGDIGDIFGSGGIYSNTTNSSLEVVTSAEWILPDGSTGFQLDAGLNLQGGASRSPNNSPKHSLSLRFRDAYGAGKLDYSLFDDPGVDSFNTLQLRAMYNNSWIHWDSGQRSRATMIRDQFIRDSLYDMGQADAGRGNYAHVYLNGLYWGVYNVHERAEASHYAAYNGGDGDDYDALNGGNPVDGNLASYNAMKATVATRDWEAIQEVLDVDNYIDWTIIQRYGSNSDLKADGNWRAAGGGIADGKWRFYAWDSERVLEGVTEGGPGGTADPPNILSTLLQIEEFRVRFADRIQKHFYNGGALTPEATAGRWNERVVELQTAIIAESARWGDYRRDVHQRNCGCVLYGLNANWLGETQRLLTSYFPNRTGIVVGQYQNLGLFPTVAAPGFEINGLAQHGGEVATGATLTLDSPSGGVVYYTLNGTDPRAEGGSAVGIEYRPGVDPPIAIHQSTTVRTRTLVGGTWSPVNEATFLVVPVAGAVVLSEINYHPYDATPEETAAVFDISADDFEFIEVHNAHPTASVNLVDMQLTRGVSFTFPNAVLAAGESAVVVENLSAFQLRYGTDVRVLGEWSGGLSNSGEAVTLADGLGNILFDVEYSDARLWAERADGAGATLELIDLAGTPAERVNRHDSWRGSTDFGGSPGLIGTPAIGIVINEVLANAGTGATDSIELYNATTAAIDLSGWYVSDSGSVPLKYEIPDGTLLGPGKYLVLTESQFNPTPTSPGPADFALSGARGDDVYLTIPDGRGGIRSFVDDVHFGGTATGVTVGRIDGGAAELVPLSRATLGCENAPARRGELIVSEVHYQPGLPSAEALNIYPDLTSGDLEFVEIYNPTTASVDLTDWRLRGGIDFDFDPGTILPAGGTLVVASFNLANPNNASRAAAFFAHYSIDDRGGIPAGFVGGYGGSLSNDEDSFRLEHPDTPPADDPMYTPHFVVDYVYYDSLAPWPASAAGGGDSLQRTNATFFGAFASGWTADAATPASVSFPGVVPGDFTGDGAVDATDIDLLYDAIRQASDITTFDLDRNGVVDAADATRLVSNIIGTQFGDANLDGVVDVRDFNRWNAAKFQTCATSWAHGNFNGDLSVDASDFALWQSPFRPQTAAAAPPAAGRHTPRAALSGQVRGLIGELEVDCALADRDEPETRSGSPLAEVQEVDAVASSDMRSFPRGRNNEHASTVVRRRGTAAADAPPRSVAEAIVDSVWHDWR